MTDSGPNASKKMQSIFPIKTEPIQNEPVVQENERTKIFIIKNHKERMQKLSGLR
jgi:hypothetical protein